MELQAIGMLRHHFTDPGGSVVTVSSFTVSAANEFPQQGVEAPPNHLT